MIDGIINVYKEKGFTSFDVVAKLRGILKQKKIGHTGTLDPMAEGVLLVCLGNATSLVDLLTEGDKIYRAKMQLGIETDTEDITGTPVKQSDAEAVAAITPSGVEEAIRSFEGEYDQIPPMYSALKKDGKKLYEYARAGVTVELEPRRVQIYSISDLILEEDGSYSFDVHCSKGTYIRSLVRDIGRKLGCYAVLTELLRKEVHGFYVQDSRTLSEIEARQQEGSLQDWILPVDALLTEYHAYSVLEAGKKYLKNGNKLSPRLFENMGNRRDRRIRVYMDGTFAALYDYIEAENIYKPFKMFI